MTETFMLMKQDVNNDVSKDSPIWMITIKFCNAVHISTE